MEFVFEWDEQKNRTNAQKHGIDFDEAATAFRDPRAKLFYDEAHSTGEDREILIGYSVNQRLVLVSFTERTRNRIRIISARVATKRERKNHETNP